MSCIFCEIVQGLAPKVFENEHVCAFNDIHPAAPIHILLVPKVHRLCFHETEPELLQHMMAAAREIIIQKGLAETGYRLIVNTGADGGQTVPHVHFHLLAGAALNTKLN